MIGHHARPGGNGRLPRRATAVAAAALVAGIAASPAWAQLGLGTSSPRKTGDELVQVAMLADVERPVAGDTFHVAFVFDIEPKWHIYWKNPGSAGMATEIAVTAPAGFDVGAIRWTRPAVFDEALGQTYGYADRAVLYVPVTAPDPVPAGDIELTASLTWLVCKEACLLGGAETALTFRSDGTTRTDGRLPRRAREAVEAHRERVSAPLEALDGAAVTRAGDTLTIEGPARGHETVSFLPIERPGVTFGPPAATVRDARFTIVVDVEIEPDNALGEALEISGLVALGERLDDPSYEFVLPAGPAPASRPAPRP